VRYLPVLLLLAACKGGSSEETGWTLDCDHTDPGGMVCSDPGQCEIECLCTDGSQIVASGCEGQCPSAESLCSVYCQGVGWSGEHCFQPEP